MSAANTIDPSSNAAPRVEDLDVAIIPSRQSLSEREKPSFFYDRSLLSASVAFSGSLEQIGQSFAGHFTYGKRLNPNNRLELAAGVSQSNESSEPFLMVSYTQLSRPTSWKWYTRYAGRVLVRPEDRMVFFLRLNNWQVQIGRGIEWIAGPQWLLRVEPYIAISAERLEFGGLITSGYAW